MKEASIVLKAVMELGSMEKRIQFKSKIILLLLIGALSHKFRIPFKFNQEIIDIFEIYLLFIVKWIQVHI